MNPYSLPACPDDNRPRPRRAAALEQHNASRASRLSHYPRRQDSADEQRRQDAADEQYFAYRATYADREKQF